MSRLFFEELRIPRPDIDLEVEAARTPGRPHDHGALRADPARAEAHLVLVVGDVNSTLACSLTAVKLGRRGPRRGGLRAFDRTMPEEINRLVTDAVSDLLFVSEPSGLDNLSREGVPEARVHFWAT